MPLKISMRIYEFETELGSFRLKATSKKQATENLRLMLEQIEAAKKMIELGQYAVQLSLARAGAVECEGKAPH